MAKRRSIVDSSYSPVRAKLAQYRQSETETTSPSIDSQAAPVLEVPPAPRVPSPVIERRIEVVPPQPAAPQPVAHQAVPPAPRPVVREEPAPRQDPLPSYQTDLNADLRARCTEEERDEWHRFALEVTGKRNNFSAVFRACLSLLEHGRLELERRKPEMQALKRPPKGNHLETALYEEKLGAIIYDALRAAGRPNSGTRRE